MCASYVSFFIQACYTHKRNENYDRMSRVIFSHLYLKLKRTKTKFHVDEVEGASDTAKALPFKRPHTKLSEENEPINQAF